MPLPPYIHRPLADPERYQTVYSADRPRATGRPPPPPPDSTSPPSCWTPCQAAGATVARVDLAIGLDTFRPVTAATPEEHVIHTERYSVPPPPWRPVPGPDRVVAVGTTAVRALESAAATGRLSGRTDLYIHGAFRFRVVDVLVTNFHLPRSSLLLLVEAFCGPRWRDLYATALAEGYRFLSFGDAMVVGRAATGRRPGTAVRSRPVHRTRVEVTATDGAARTGTVHTARGAYAVPAFMPVGTRGAVKALDSADLEALGAEVVLANTYHLLLRPGAEVVAALGGLHRFTGWEGHTLTDSGGFQVHSLRPDVDDDGVTFASVYDGSRVRLTPESAVEAQGLLGADIQMVLDVCATPAGHRRGAPPGRRADGGLGGPGPPHHDRLEAVPEGQALFGIVQGGTDPGLRAESAERTVALDFDGYGIGGLSVGEPRAAMLEALAATVPHLPGRPAPLPDGGGRPGRHGRGRRPRGRPVRLRGPDPDGPARHHPDHGRDASTSATPSTPATTAPSTPPAAARPAPGGPGGTSGTCWRWGSPPPGGC